MARRSAVLLLVLVACGGEKKPATPATAAQATYTFTDPRGAIFAQKGCPQCHSIPAFGIKSPTDVGPDLGKAYADVQTRFGVKLNEFLAAPTGTMQMVLSSMIKLTPAERDSIIHILTELHEQQHEAHEEGSHQ